MCVCVCACVCGMHLYAHIGAPALIGSLKDCQAFDITQMSKKGGSGLPAFTSVRRVKLLTV